MFSLRPRKPNRRAEICAAIGARRVIRFCYGSGSHAGLRVVEPYCYGRLGDGEETLLCYQVSGYDRFDVPVGWKIYRPSETSDLEVSTEEFAPRRSTPVYDARARLFTAVYCQLPPLKREEPPLQTGGTAGALRDEMASQ